MSRPDRRPEETRAGGLAPLAVLPVFVPLRGHRAVVLGGNAGAAWKARLLASAGARVDVIAAELSEGMREAPGTVPDGSVTLHQRPWAAGDLAGARVVIVALEDAEEAQRAVDVARQSGAIVNAVDRPELCDVQFGAIVNRSPLVVGISTDGAAPVLAQTLRSRIEALVPVGLARWLAAAKLWRDEVAGRIASMPARRAFWQRFADRAFGEPDRAPTPDDLDDLLAGGTDETGGSVTLVGAGPGDPELLTLAAVRALRGADVVLYDDLVSPDVLAFARREARTMLVGKTGHRPSCRQEDINVLMIGLARQGKRVVRLKSGDPGVFGRGGEEIAAAHEAGIPVAIVPGVTAAQGAAARLGVSLTERGVARRVQYVTGHDRDGALPEDLNGAALADPGVTTAVYMPRRTVPALVARALAAGLPAATPAVAIVDATRPGERRVITTVGDLKDAIATLPAGPCLVLIGDVLRAARSGVRAPAADLGVSGEEQCMTAMRIGAARAS
ncbi:siroheme synthase CysG [Rhodoplanes roseus]|uniref:Uroporphyrinogen-III C-methyltransferase n=1 Tax=Rhodoplanes roseus TaxID=29409 RepID=A0A327KTR0_9BRAD|nr:siroheme synthase CysG [Rhodoplanes roseus]RAI41033.1 uroporphyrinogen-III C-methyltransferase [Rhodoplanes roseus]